MSTPGKVLIILVALTVLVWIVLFAKVANHNSTQGAKVDGMEKNLKTQEQKLTELRAQVRKMVTDTTLEQTGRDKQISVLRNQLSDVEDLQAKLSESLIRVELDMQGIQAAMQDVQAGQRERNQEKADTIKALNETTQKTRMLMTQNADLLNELSGLRDQFKQTLAENQQMIQRLRSAAQSKGEGGSVATRRRRVQPATLRD